ncbi:MAG: hypothetical protein ACOYLI_08385 [Synechococcus lacustris]
MTTSTDHCQDFEPTDPGKECQFLPSALHRWARYKLGLSLGNNATSCGSMQPLVAPRGHGGVTPIWQTVVPLGVVDRLKHGRQGKLDPFIPVADRSQHHR